MTKLPNQISRTFHTHSWWLWPWWFCYVYNEWSILL